VTWAKLAAGLIEAFNLVMTWLGRERDRQAGRDEQKVADLTKSLEAENVRKKVETVVGAADPVAHARMLDRWRRRD
jgi:hypothetical protein